MLINEIIVNELNLNNVDFSKLKNIKYKGVNYTWNKELFRFIGPNNKEVAPTGLLFKQLIKAQPQALGKSGQRFTSKIAQKLGISGLGQSARNDPDASTSRKVGAWTGALIGRGIDNLIGMGSKKQDPNSVEVADAPTKGDIRPLVDKNGKPIDFPSNDGTGTMFNHAFEFKGQQWVSSVTGKHATKDEAENLNGQYIRKGIRNDPTDDFQNLQRQIKAGKISPEDGKKIIAIYKRGEAKTLNDAYHIFQKLKRNETGPKQNTGNV